ncbi:MAG: hypothetical protein IRZ03_10665 [Acidobacterium ailaaui]|nr:hypothetical protein [Pseudacidobacterium ailaaui]
MLEANLPNFTDARHSASVLRCRIDIRRSDHIRQDSRFGNRNSNGRLLLASDKEVQVALLPASLFEMKDEKKTEENSD